MENMRDIEAKSARIMAMDVSDDASMENGVKDHKGTGQNRRFVQQCGIWLLRCGLRCDNGGSQASIRSQPVGMSRLTQLVCLI
jgi:hypothetical protein